MLAVFKRAGVLLIQAQTWLALLLLMVATKAINVASFGVDGVDSKIMKQRREIKVEYRIIRTMEKNTTVRV